VKKSPFYFEIKDVLIQFISAFNDVVISRYNSAREDKDQISVRYVYAPKQRVLHDLVNKAQHITLPAIAVKIGDISYDKDRVFNKIMGSYHPRVDKFQGHDLRTVSDHLPQPTPIDITVDMSILTKYQTDMDQILSNFIPYNNPYITISWPVPTELLQTEQEIRSEVLWSGSLNIDYPVSITNSDPYRISADTSFTIKSWLFRHKDDPVGNIFTVNSFFTALSGIDGLT
jgi:hypothetical protein